MSALENAKWIWYTENATPDSYGEFSDRLVFGGGSAVMRISCDSDYTLFVNGGYAASGQYGDFEHYKIYDEVEITDLLTEGENEILFLVHYFGADSSRYRVGTAGLIYEAEAAGRILLQSSEATLSRQSPTYVSGNMRRITEQLGFSLTYDARRENEGTGYTPSVAVDKRCRLFPRPIKKQAVLPRTPMKSIRSLGATRLLVDLGGEAVGLPSIELRTEVAQRITVAWGEHVKDGGVRMLIGQRKFYFEYMAKEGLNDFTTYMLRIGCRYLEIISEAPIELIYAGVRPQVYEVTERRAVIADELDRRIYEASVNTLRKCMMEHYVDCPWREQCLYAFDSRNQMLCGYYAFEGGNAAYAGSNLKLLGEDRRGDGLLSICAPCGVRLAIPTFSLYYIMEMKEYVEHTGDTGIAREMLPKLRGILDEFLLRYKDGLIHSFEGEDMWNFYDWTEFASGTDRRGAPAEPDLFINALFLIALDNFGYVCRRLDEVSPYPEGLSENIRRRMRECFFRECGAFSARVGTEEYTVLGNSLAILSGAVKGEEAAALCERIAGGGMVDCSLSMKVLEYEALLSVDAERYRDLVLEEIRESYGMMLERGSDTFWETIGGEADFSGAGSLCHGWSAIPIYFFHRLGVATYPDGRTGN